MSTGLKARGRNYVHAFSKAIASSAVVAVPISAISFRRNSSNIWFRWNAINKTESGDLLVQQNLYLIFETNWFVRAIGRLDSSDTF